jgi:UDP-glucose 4-epimerase
VGRQKKGDVKMKVIVFGGSGFLGSHVADILTKEKHEVIIFDKEASPYLNKNQVMIVGDILEQAKVDKAMAGCDVVYNFAGITDIDTAKANPIETVKNNVLGNTILLESARKNKIKRYVFASSIYVYSHRGSFYRTSKQASELFIESYHEAYGLNYTILRYGSLYGPRANRNNWILRILEEALTHKRIIRFGDGEEIREYIHVFDAAQCSIDILSKEYENEHVIISGHQPIKIKDLLIMVKEMLNADVEIIYNKADAKGCPYDPALHYEMTPYSFKPRIAKKIVSRHYVDLGQGMLSELERVHKSFTGKKKEELLQK